MKKAKTAAELFRESFEKKALSTLFKTGVYNRKAIGRDGITVNAFRTNLSDEIDLILKKIFNFTYRFTGYQQKLVSKGAKKKPRQLSIPTVRDRLVLRALCNVLAESFPKAAIPLPHVFIKNIKSELQTSPADTVFLRVDMKLFFDSIPHDLLLKKLRSKIRKKEVLFLVEKAIRTPTGENSKVISNDQGVPQGLSISNILASIYMTKFDEMVSNKAPYFRYVDDILILCRKGEAEQVFEFVKNKLAELKLESHELNMDKGKTFISTLDQGAEYLGFQIRSHSDISVRPSSYRRMFKNLIGVFTQYKHKKDVDRFLWRLNLKITGCIFNGKRYGWLFFFSQTENVSQLKRLDAFVTRQIVKYRIAVAPDRVRRFAKTFYEIRFNLASSDYIPNFDEYSPAEILQTMRALSDKSDAEFDSMSMELVQEEFEQMLVRETAALERDLIEARQS